MFICKPCKSGTVGQVRSTDHWYYEKVLLGGTVLRTKLGRSLHREIPKHLWQRILKKQLKITEKELGDSL
ncbi:MAG TPA: hypothetical protein GXX39_05170 [Syntrophothermus lipocalidus]|nr:hypothetical protein [Syntrophothermus lipocalidus]